jgi:uncharacterized membrane-anchored protein YjiN (DUF445 family)
MPEGLSAGDAARLKGLRRMRALALSLLVLAAVVYVLTRHHDTGWLGYVNAGSEAAMVGAIADWFAVTALFRHPLGLPIPHTAIIPNRKESLGESLQEFVADNFLREDVIRERIASAGVGIVSASGWSRATTPIGWCARGHGFSRTRCPTSRRPMSRPWSSRP